MNQNNPRGITKKVPHAGHSIPTIQHHQPEIHLLPPAWKRQRTARKKQWVRAGNAGREVALEQ